MLSSLSVRRPHLIIVIIMVTLLLGGIAYSNTTVDFLPNMNLPYVVVATVCPGLTPEEVESGITVAVEGAVRQLDCVDAVTSTSAEHYSLLIIELKGDADLETAVFQLQSSLNLIKGSLPDGTQDSIIVQLNPSMLPVMEISVSERGKSVAQSSDYLKSVKERVQNVGGVSSVTATGLIDNLLLVMMSGDKMSAFISGAVMPDRDDYYYESTDGEGQPVLEFDEEAYNKAVENSLKLGDDLSALISENLTNELLATAIYAQNLELPAGSVSYGSGSLILKIGDKIASLDEFKNTPVITFDFKAAFEKYGKVLNIFKSFTVSEQALNKLIDAADENGAYKIVLQSIINDLNDPAHSTLFNEISPGNYILKPSVLDELRVYGNAVKGLYGLTFPEAQLDDLDLLVNGMSDFVSGSGLFERITEDEGGNAVPPYYRLRTELTGSGLYLSNLVEQLETRVFTEEDTENAAVYLTSLKGAGDTMGYIGGRLKTFLSDSPYFTSVYKTDSLGNIVYETVDGVSVPVIDYYKTDNDLIERIRGLGAVTVKLQDISDIIELNTAGVAHNIVNGESGVIISVSKQPDFSTVEVTEAVLEVLDQCAAENSQFGYLVLSNQGESANMMLNSIAVNIALGALLVIVVLFIFLRDIKPTLVVASSMAVSILAAFTAMYFAGISLNILSMAGLCISVGEIVDNSIVVLENIYKLRAEGKDVKSASVDGAKQMAGAMLSSTLTTIVMFVPLMFIEGLTKQVFSDIALTFLFALAASLLVSLTFVPMVANRALVKGAKLPPSYFSKFSGRYERILKKTLGKKWIVITVVTVLFASSAVGALFMEKEFFPSAEGQYLSMTVKLDKNKLPDVYTYDEAVDVVITALYGRLESSGYVEDMGIALTKGYEVAGYSVNGENITATIVLKDKIKKSASEIAEEMIVSLKSELETYVIPEAAYTVSYNADNSFFSGLVSKNKLSLDVNGSDMTQLRATAAELSALLGQIEGVKLVDDGIGEIPMEYYIVVDKQKASSLAGMTAGELLLAINAALSEAEPSTTVTYEDTGDTYKVYVYSTAYKVTRWHKVLNQAGGTVKLYIDHTGGYYVPLDGVDVPVSKEGNRFYYTVGGVEYVLSGEGDLVYYYDIGRKEPLDILTYRLSNIVLEGTDFEYRLSVPLYKLLGEESFAKDAEGNIIYRTEIVEDIAGNLVRQNILDDDGNPIPASVAMRESYQAIERFNGSRRIKIEITYTDSANGNKVERQIKALLAGYQAAEGVDVEYVGSNRLVQAVYKDLYFVLIIGVFLMYAVMAAQFKSFKLPLLIMITVPLAFTGTVFALLITGTSISIMALLGIIILMGIVVNNGIIYISTAQELMEGGTPKEEAVILAATSRLRPIVMTALTTIVGLFATALDGGADGAMFQPMAIAVVGGLIYATLLTLVLLPVVMDLVYRHKQTNSDLNPGNTEFVTEKNAGTAS